jgi:hypothetical protein
MMEAKISPVVTVREEDPGQLRIDSVHSIGVQVR